jgi:RHS repeat-associated protein
LTSKVTKVTSPEGEIERVIYEYNLQNRLYKVKVSTDGGSTWDSITDYKYDFEGNRVEKNVNGVVTKYLIDISNHTGYSQVLEEWSPGNSVPDKTYAIGDDIISQADDGGNPQYFLYDGHGSARQLSNSSGEITEAFSYDGYGMLLGGNPPRGSTPATNLMYAGEYFDTEVQHYNLRARYYDPLNGRFNQMDSFAGNNEDPQSLHKYLYCHANPVNMTDPSGYFGDMGFAGILAATSIQSVMYGIILGASINAYSGGKIALGFGSYISYLFQGNTWAVAAKGILGAIRDLIQEPGRLILTVLLGLFSHIFSIIGIAQTAWDIIGMSSAMTELSRSGLSVEQLAYFAAITTASIIITFATAIIIGRIIGAAGERMRRGGGGSGDIDLDQVLNDPALRNVDLTVEPTYNSTLPGCGVTYTRRSNTFVEIGPSALVNRKEAIATIIHEETHIRLAARAARNSMQARSVRCNIICEENY